MTRKLPIEIINEVANLIPMQVLEDIQNRMGSWVLSGGKHDDPYMYQQSEYAQRWAEKVKKEQEDV